MAVTVDGSATQTATIGTEHTLYQSTSAATFELGVDLNAMAAGDVLELRAKKMYKTGGTPRTVVLKTFQGAQATDDYGAVTIPMSCGLTDTGAVTFTLKQTLGTGRAYDWEVLKFA